MVTRYGPGRQEHVSRVLQSRNPNPGRGGPLRHPPLSLAALALGGACRSGLFLGWINSAKAPRYICVHAYRHGWARTSESGPLMRLNRCKTCKTCETWPFPSPSVFFFSSSSVLWRRYFCSLEGRSWRLAPGTKTCSGLGPVPEGAVGLNRAFGREGGGPCAHLQPPQGLARAQ